MKSLGLLFLIVAQALAQPTLTKIEPPNWWPGHTLNPVRLLLRGNHLQGAGLEVSGGLTIAHTLVNAKGTYLFCDLTIPEDATPGERTITVRTTEGTATIPFRVDAPLPAKGRFQGFSSDDVIYLLMPDRFSNGDKSNDDPAISKGLFNPNDPQMYHGGDLQGVIDRLPYLKTLGITAIWMTPVYENVNELNFKQAINGKPRADYHGYGVTDYYGVEEHFGNVALFRKLTDSAHALGIKVIQDQVANHTGPYHPWVANPPLPDWFHGTAANHVDETWQIWTLNDPNASASVTRPVLDGWFNNVLPDMNQENAEVAQYEIQNALWWVGVSGIDGIRQDTLPYVPRGFWKPWSAALKRQYPDLRVVGEVFDQDPALTSSFQTDDTGIDSVFDFPLYFKLREVFAQGRQVEAIPKVLAHDGLYRNAGSLVTFLGLHDVARFLNEKNATVNSLKQAFTCLLTTRGIPMIYYGDEIAMRGGEDPDNRRDFPVSAFLNRQGEQAEVYNHVRTLLGLRASHIALRQGTTANLAVQPDQWIYTRTAEEEIALVAINTAAAEVTLQVPLRRGGVLESAFGPMKQVNIDSGTADIRMPAHSAQLYFVR